MTVSKPLSLCSSLWICIFILEIYDFCIDWLCYELSIAFHFWQDRIDPTWKLSFLKCLVTINMNIIVPACFIYIWLVSVCVIAFFLPMGDQISDCVCHFIACMCMCCMCVWMDCMCVTGSPGVSLLLSACVGEGVCVDACSSCPSARLQV